MPLLRCLSVLILLAGSVGCWSRDAAAPVIAPSARKPPSDAVPIAPVADVTPSPYRNTSLDVAYVGDETCAECHQELAESYAAHPMGQSMRDIAADGVKDFDDGALLSFDAEDFRYTASWDGQRMVHTEERLDTDGKPLHQVSHEMAFEVGAGMHGRSYLFTRGDTLWMSPMTYYPQERRWAFSPNYENLNQHFNRGIVADCVFCHSHRAHPVAGTINQYESPMFSKLAIGCERCHGPGELHVQRHTEQTVAADTVDDTIVNPARLEPMLRDGGCQQCHLVGKERVVRRGRDPYDYRPGLAWHEFMSTFVEATPDDEDLATVTGHVEQMHASTCFEGSDAALSCVSCHDPHKKPAAADMAAYFRERCNNCHADQGCVEDQVTRQATTPPDNCITCHMPSVASDVKHAAITDHRIPRNAQGTTAGPPRKRTGLPIELFHRDLVDQQEPDTRRDIGIAVMRLVAQHPEMIERGDNAAVLPMLLQAVKRDSTDSDAAEALARAQLTMNNVAGALRTLEAAIANAPQHEQIRVGAWLATGQSHAWERAHQHLGKLIDANPHEADYFQMQAQTAVGMNDIDLGVEACQKALRLNPANDEVRRLLVRLLTRAGRSEDAKPHLDILQRAAP